MRKGRKLLVPLLALFAVLSATLTLYFLFFRPAYALQVFFTDTTLLDFNEGFLYHTALAWHDDGEVTLLPIGLGQPWITATALPVARAGHAAVYYDGRIYVIGGDDATGMHTDVFYTTIDPDTHELAPWSTTTPLPSNEYPEGLYFHEAIALNGFIYVFGGSEDAGGASTYYDKVVYAPILSDGTLGDWQTTVSLPRALYGMETAVVNDYIYVIGGADSLAQSCREVYYTKPAAPSGEITGWYQTSALLPTLGAGGYFDSAVAVEHGRIYIYGGSSGRIAPSYSPYVHFAEPDVSGDIPSWTFGTENLPQNCYASEGAAYQSGLLLAVSGAWNNAIDPSGDVRASLVDHDTGQPIEWISTLGLYPGRFYHAVVQDEFGWLYCIGGKTGASSGHLSEVQVAPPYAGGGLLRQLGRRMQHTEAASRTVYAPTGTFTSPPTDVTLAEDQSASLTSLVWNTTITDPNVMSITLAYRYHGTTGWTGWYGPYPSNPGIATTTTITLSGSCDMVQYKAFFTSTISTTTPILNRVDIGVLAPPDLVADDLTVTGCDGCPSLVRPYEPVQIQFTVYNRSTSLRYNNNFFAMAFITTSPTYWPSGKPGELPPGCSNYPTETCPLIWPLQALDFEETDPPIVLTATWTFTTPGTYYLIACVDYNDTPSHPPPLFDVVEHNEYNNCPSITILVGEKRIYLPLLTKD